MAKTNSIRKKALEHAKKQRWDKALEEFERLVEVERNNPNVYNEIGDLYLKLGKKREAFDSYHSAVDAYARISLHNNAVAVCKKILRLNANDQFVCGKLAKLRHRQGFQKDAETYALTFLGQLSESGEPPTDKLKDLVVEATRAAGDAVEVLERAADYLITSECHDEAGKVLEKLEQIYQHDGRDEQCKLVRKRMDAIGWVSSSVPGKDIEPSKLETVESHRSSYARGADGDDTGASGGGTSGAVEDYGTVELGQTGIAGPAPPVAETQPTPDEHADAHQTVETVITDAATEPDPDTTGQGEWVIPDPDDEPPAGDGGVISELSSEVTADIDEEDYRSHYDLGMAYVEMNLLTEAIREFQFATNSSMYRVRSLEMIGRCFIDQNKPQLAIKQLTRGLALVGDDDQDSLGIRYSLGVAFEMIGEIDKARTFFEDVYVVDVSFRDVAEKMEQYAN